MERFVAPNDDASLLFDDRVRHTNQRELRTRHDMEDVRIKEEYVEDDPILLGSKSSCENVCAHRGITSDPSTANPRINTIEAFQQRQIAP